jgi:pimeloyl-ACP methyl ester carboxylesterase
MHATRGERDRIARYPLEDRIAALRAPHPEVIPHPIHSTGHWAPREQPGAFNAVLAELSHET